MVSLQRLHKRTNKCNAYYYTFLFRSNEISLTCKTEMREEPVFQTQPFQHCLHMRNLDSDLDYLFIFRCKHCRMPDAQCHVNMACNQWLGTWDVAIIYTGRTRICVTVQWMSVDCMTLYPAKLNLIRTAAVNSRVMTGESQTQSRSIASVHPLHNFVAKTHSYLTVYDRYM